MSVPADEPTHVDPTPASVPSPPANPGETLLDPHLGPVEEATSVARDQYDASELAIVLSHFDIGVIRRIREYRRGSRRAPKLRIDTQQGEFLLKRRAPGRDEVDRVSFGDQLHAALVKVDYPVAPLIVTRDGRHQTMRWKGRVYELFEYLRGDRDDGSNAAARESGALLGRLHGITRELTIEPQPRRSSYHATKSVAHALQRIPRAVTAAEPDVDLHDLAHCCAYLRDAYNDATRHVERCGFSTWVPQIIHGDWHPGNLLYRRGRIVAVLDFDAARVEPRVIEVANAGLQVAMTVGDPEDPMSWPDAIDHRRMRRLVRGYEEGGSPLEPSERAAMPWLIIEALVAESAGPIATAGRFGTLSGADFLGMVRRKIEWIRPRASRIVRYIEGSS